MRLDSSDSRHGPVAGSREHGNESSESIKRRVTSRPAERLSASHYRLCSVELVERRNC
jgi:hypothetical protein